MHTRIGLSIITLVLFLILFAAQTPAVQGQPSGVEAHQNLAVDLSGRVVDITFDQDLALNAPWDRFRFDMNRVQPLARDGGAFLGDLTGDGVLDLVIASFTGERLFFPGMSGHPSQFGDGLYLKHTTTNSSEDPYHDSGQDGLWVSGDVGDLDGDGNKEIVLGMKLSANVGTAAEPKLDLRYTFESSGTVWDPSPSIGDLNGDGKPDVVITYQSDSKSNDTYVYWNNSTSGSYSFTPELLDHWDSKLVTSSRVALGDLNGDGLLDLAGPAGIYFNTGTSTTPDFAFAAPVTWNKTGGPDWTAANDQPGHVFLKDGDGDGLLDAYVSNLSSTAWQVLFYRNVGSASSYDLRYIGPVVAASSPLDLAERGKTIPDSYPYQSFLSQGDVDQNGRLDVLVGTGGGETSGAPTILWHFPLEGGTPGQTLSYQDLYSWPALDRVSYLCGGTNDALCRPPNLLSAWTDLAGDSMPDGLRADEWSNPTGSYKLYIRARSGTVPFNLNEDVPLLTNPSNSQALARGVALIDVDSDGFLDMVTGAADGKLLFYRNTGNSGSFADPVPLKDSNRRPDRCR